MKSLDGRNEAMYVEKNNLHNKDYDHIILVVMTRHYKLNPNISEALQII